MLCICFFSFRFGVTFLPLMSFSFLVVSILCFISSRLLEFLNECTLCIQSWNVKQFQMNVPKYTQSDTSVIKIDLCRIFNTWNEMSGMNVRIILLPYLKQHTICAKDHIFHFTSFFMPRSCISAPHTKCTMISKSFSCNYNKVHCFKFQTINPIVAYYTSLEST